MIAKKLPVAVFGAVIRQQDFPLKTFTFFTGLSQRSPHSTLMGRIAPLMRGHLQTLLCGSSYCLLSHLLSYEDETHPPLKILLCNFDIPFIEPLARNVDLRS